MNDTDQPETTNGINDQSDSLLRRARQTEEEQEALVESSTFETLKAEYGKSLEIYTEEKYHQVERIEDRLENLIEKQEALLDQYQTEHAKMILKPGKRAALEQQIQARQACILRLHNRLDLVREIREEMTPYGPKIEELAARKLRFHEPELATSWDAARAADRRRQLEHRKEKSQAAQVVRTLSRSLGIKRESS